MTTWYFLRMTEQKERMSDTKLFVESHPKFGNQDVQSDDFSSSCQIQSHCFTLKETELPGITVTADRIKKYGWLAVLTTALLIISNK